MFSWLNSIYDPSTLLERGHIYRGLMCAVNRDYWSLIKFHIEQELKVPEPDNTIQLRALLLALATQLINLSKSATDPRNPVPSTLKKSVQSEVHAAFDALAQTCERLEVVAQQGVNPARLQTELEQEAANLRQLLEATEEASAEMARLTLSAGRWQVTDASDKFAHLGWAARELTQFNRQMEE